MTRDVGLGTKLIQCGVFDLAKNQELLNSKALTTGQLEQILQLASIAADADLVIAKLVANLSWLELPAEQLKRLALLIGASIALGELVEKRSELLTALISPAPTNRDLLVADFISRVENKTSERARSALKQRYQNQLVSIAARDLIAEIDFNAISTELSWLADAVLAAALQIASSENPDQANQVELAVIAMGKTGGNELNYISDVDVIFIGKPVGDTAEEVAMAAGAKLASSLINICSEPTIDGVIWPVDAALRPEGKAGPLVRSVSSYLGYYQRWAETWEFQALLKARCSAGDQLLAAEFLAAVTPLVWQAVAKPNFVENARKMRIRVEENISSKEHGRQLKLGRGGLRDIEFAVQLLQLVHGRADQEVRSGNTLAALAALAAGGYVGRKDAEALHQNYIWLRTLEHRLQLRKMQRTHVLPENEFELRVIGRSIGLRQDSAAELNRSWEQVANQVRDLHEKLFYRPLLDAVAVLPSESVRLSEAEAEMRLQALGYLDAQAALRHIQALTTGSQRRAAIQRTLLPVLLHWWSTGPNPDKSLLAFRRISEALGDSPWFLSSLRDDAQVAERVAKVTSASEFLVNMLLRAPETLAMLADNAELVPISVEVLNQEAAAIISRHTADPQRAVGALRAMRRRELVRIATGAVLEILEVDQIGAAITTVNKVVLNSTLIVVQEKIAAEISKPVPTDFAMIAMGRFGGAELGFGSDLDLIFVHRPHDGVAETEATPIATKIAAEIRSLLMAPHPDPAIEIDADLRPEGKKGALVRTLDSYQSYYDRWSISWESQALLRADYAAGDEKLAADFLEVINPLRWPSNGMPEAEIREVRLLKARMEAERLPKGANPALHLKLGKGGLSDVEWVAQLIQLRFAGSHAALQKTSTIETLQAAVELAIITQADAAVLIEAWRMSTKIRNAITLSLGKNSDSIPIDQQDLRNVAFLLGYATDSANLMVEQYLRTARRSREVFERLFYDS
jgi:[glutamine synthetase] adenylyltransferase / [glutamine synthetase]-adenylyl-L-tyrosine phosphorylase